MFPDLPCRPSWCPESLCWSWRPESQSECPHPSQYPEKKCNILCYLRIYSRNEYFIYSSSVKRSFVFIFCFLTLFFYLHGHFELLSIILSRGFEQSQNHILQVSLQSSFQCGLQRLWGKELMFIHSFDLFYCYYLFIISLFIYRDMLVVLVILLKSNKQTTRDICSRSRQPVCEEKKCTRIIHKLW